MVEKYKVDSVVCDYGVYEWTNRDGKVTRDLRLICNSRSIALVISKLMNWDFSENTMTNGDVIKALFPNRTILGYEDESGDRFCELENISVFDETWWNAPYGRED